jgi:NADP-dependent 3-hydroxy acid dehydrogenase YdfG
MASIASDARDAVLYDVSRCFFCKNEAQGDHNNDDNHRLRGGSSGISEATARALAHTGYTVYAGARRVERMQHLKEHGIQPLALDVTDEESMQSAVSQIVAEQGRIDILVNNAGYGSYGALEDVPLSEARSQFEVNVFGASRLTQLVLLQMRQQRSGTIVNITSMGGKIYTPLGSWYHATKFALEAISDCLRMELKPFNINVVVIEPGGIQNHFMFVRMKEPCKKKMPHCS